MCCGTQPGSYLRLIDSCITQLKAQGPSRTCNKSEDDEEVSGFVFRVSSSGFRVSGFGFRVSGFGFQASGFEFRVSGCRLQVSGSGFRDPDAWYRGISAASRSPHSAQLLTIPPAPPPPALAHPTPPTSPRRPRPAPPAILAAGRAWRVQKCVVVTEAGSYLRLIDSCITQLKAQGPSRTCNESKEDEISKLSIKNSLSCFPDLVFGDAPEVEEHCLFEGRHVRYEPRRIKGYCRISPPGAYALGSWFRVQSFGCGVQGTGFRVQDSRFRV